jgi:hypothetical protein
VLLSISFIFGQTRKSRRLAHSVALASLEPHDRDKAFDVLLHGKMDRFLLAQPTPNGLNVSNAKTTPSFVRPDFLTPWANFPLLGERLLKLQRYNDKQRPTQTRKMIRDKRDPSRWYTLWVVLLVGGLSVVLSAMQLVVSCAQLAYAVKDGPPPAVGV